MTGNRSVRWWSLPRLLLVGMFTAGAAVVALSNVFVASRTADYVETGVQLSANLTKNITLPDGKYLSGTVKDASGAVVPGAIVEAVSDEGYVSTPTVAGVLGAFKLPVRPGTYRLEVRPPFPTSADISALPRQVPTTTVTFTVQKDTKAGTVTLPDGYRVQGGVSTDAGSAKNLIGFMLAVPTDGASPWWVTPAVFDAGNKSRNFALVLPAGNFSLNFVSGQAYGTAWTELPMSSYASTAVTVSADRSINVRISAGSKVQGTVRDKSGKKMSGLLFIKKSGSSAVGEGGTTLLVVMAGTFHGYLPVGSYDAVFVPHFDAGYKGRGTRTLVSFDVPATGGATVPITAVSGVLLTGRITDARGQVVKTASLTVIPSTADPTSLAAIPMTAKSDEKTGDYTLCLPAGTYDIQAVPSGFGELSAFERLAAALR